MNVPADYDIAKAWVALQYTERNSSEFDALFWAHMSLDELLDDDRERFWLIINEIRKIDDSDFLLSNLAAGPIEDSLVRAGETFIERMEELARRDEKFKRLLGMLWKNEIRDDIWVRIQRVI